MDLLSTSTVSLVSGTFPIHFRLIREPFLLFLVEWINFSLFITQLAMPTPFNITNMDQKKPNRWAPVLNYWKVWFIINRVFYHRIFRTYDSISKIEPWKVSTALFYTPSIGIFHQTESFKKTDLSNLFAIVAGGSAMKKELQLQFEDSFQKYHPGQIPPYIKQ